MKTLVPPLILVAVLSSLWACGRASSGSAPEIHNSNRAAETGSVVSNASSPPAVPAGPQVSASEQTANTATAPESIQDIRGRRADILRAPTGAQTGTASAPKPSLHPAPDNSVYSVVLTDAAVETRAFKNHPQLLKVEKRNDAKRSSIKVFLRDGRVINLPGEKIEALATAPASAILSAAGLSSPADDGRKPAKKKIQTADPQ